VKFNQASTRAAHALSAKDKPDTQGSMSGNPIDYDSKYRIMVIFIHSTAWLSSIKLAHIPV